MSPATSPASVFASLPSPTPPSGYSTLPRTSSPAISRSRFPLLASNPDLGCEATVPSNFRYYDTHSSWHPFLYSLAESPLHIEVTQGVRYSLAATLRGPVYSGLGDHRRLQLRSDGRARLFRRGPFAVPLGHRSGVRHRGAAGGGGGRGRSGRGVSRRRWLRVCVGNGREARRRRRRP